MSCGVPPVVSTVTDSLKVTVAVTASPVLKAPSVPALLNAMESTLGPAGNSYVAVSVTESPELQLSPELLHLSTPKSSVASANGSETLPTFNVRSERVFVVMGNWSVRIHSAPPLVRVTLWMT